MKEIKYSTRTLSGILSFGGLFIALLGAQIKERAAESELTEALVGLLMVLAFFLWGCMGLIWVLRREAPQFVTVRGKQAVFLGIFLILSFWGIGLYGLYLVVIRFFH